MAITKMYHKFYLHLFMSTRDLQKYVIWRPDCSPLSFQFCSQPINQFFFLRGRGDNFTSAYQLVTLKNWKYYFLSQKRQQERFLFSSQQRYTNLSQFIQTPTLANRYIDNYCKTYTWQYNLVFLKWFLSLIETKLCYNLFVIIIKSRSTFVFNYRYRDQLLNHAIFKKFNLTNLVESLVEQFLRSNQIYFFLVLSRVLLTNLPYFFHRFIIAWLQLFLQKFFTTINQYTNIKGVVVVIRGKVGRRGAGRKAAYIINAGKYSSANYLFKKDTNLKNVYLKSGVVGIRGLVLFRINEFFFRNWHAPVLQLIFNKTGLSLLLI